VYNQTAKERESRSGGETSAERTPRKGIEKEITICEKKGTEKNGDRVGGVGKGTGKTQAEDHRKKTKKRERIYLIAGEGKRGENENCTDYDSWKNRHKAPVGGSGTGGPNGTHKEWGGTLKKNLGKEKIEKARASGGGIRKSRGQK